MKPEEFISLFAKASKLREDPSKILPESKWDSALAEDGAKRFKKQVLGWGHKKRDLSVDQVATELYNAEIVATVEAGREIVPQLYEQNRIGYGWGGELYFEKVQNAAGEELCRVGAVYYQFERWK